MRFCLCLALFVSVSGAYYSADHTLPTCRCVIMLRCAWCVWCAWCVVDLMMCSISAVSHQATKGNEEWNVTRVIKYRVLLAVSLMVCDKTYHIPIINTSKALYKHILKHFIKESLICVLEELLCETYKEVYTEGETCSCGPDSGTHKTEAQHITCHITNHIIK